MSDHKKGDGSLKIEQMASLKSWGAPPSSIADELDSQAIVECGWGRLIFGQTFTSNTRLAQVLQNERPGQRDVAIYSRDPQVLISKAPQELFIDPSLTFRLDLSLAVLEEALPKGIEFVAMTDDGQARQVNRIYKARGMVPLRKGFLKHLRQHPETHILLAIDKETGHVVGCVTGVDHFLGFADPDNGSSLWALAVDPQCLHAGVGKALVIELARHFKSRGRAFMDLSVMHDNQEAIGLYRKLHFYQVPVYCIKTKNAINEQLYLGPKPDQKLNIYAQIIVDEAYRRGIAVDIVDPAAGYFDLSLGGRTISCRESLTELTNAVALSRCNDKAVTRLFLLRAGLQVPEQVLLSSANEALEFLQQHSRIVIKPAQGEQGTGVFVDLSTPAAVVEAFQSAASQCEQVLGETFVSGDDLRIIVINGELVAAAIRKPASIVGDGTHTIAELINKQSRRRITASQGESRIPVDAETERCIADAGMVMEQVLPLGDQLEVRKTANLHTGGTLHDVTESLHPELVEAALLGAEALDIPVVGFDFIVAHPSRADYVIIEANERPGLANHEPQPTAAKLIDMLFPQTASCQR